MAKILRDKSGRLFLECTHLKGNKAYTDAQLAEKDLPPAFRKDGKRTPADDAAKQEAAKQEAQAEERQKQTEQAQAPKPATKPAPKPAPKQEATKSE